MHGCYCSISLCVGIYHFFEELASCSISLCVGSIFAFRRTMASFQPVTDLSDDENQVVPVAKPVQQRRRISCGFKGQVIKHRGDSVMRKLRRLVESKCGCNGDCFKPYRESIKEFDKIVNLRKILGAMTKLEQDNEAAKLTLLA